MRAVRAHIKQLKRDVRGRPRRVRRVSWVQRIGTRSCGRSRKLELHTPHAQSELCARPRAAPTRLQSTPDSALHRAAHHIIPSRGLLIVHHSRSRSPVMIYKALLALAILLVYRAEVVAPASMVYVLGRITRPTLLQPIWRRSSWRHPLCGCSPPAPRRIARSRASVDTRERPHRRRPTTSPASRRRSTCSNGLKASW